MKWAGLGWGCGISLAAAVMTVDCTGFTEPLPCPGPALLHTTLQACVQRARPQPRTAQFYCDQTSLDKWWWHCAWHKSSHDWYRRTQYINHYKHVSIWSPWRLRKTLNIAKSLHFRHSRPTHCWAQVLAAGAVVSVPGLAGVRVVTVCWTQSRPAQPPW